MSSSLSRQPTENLGEKKKEIDELFCQEGIRNEKREEKWTGECLCHVCVMFL